MLLATMLMLPTCRTGSPHVHGHSFTKIRLVTVEHNVQYYHDQVGTWDPRLRGPGAGPHRRVRLVLRVQFNCYTWQEQIAPRNFLLALRPKGYHKEEA